MVNQEKVSIFLSESHTAGTFNHALARFLRRQQQRVSLAHLWHLFRSLVALSEALGNPGLADVTRQDLQDYVAQLHLRYSPGTVRPVVGDIKQFFRYCRKKSLIPANPAKKLRKPRPRHIRDKAAGEGDCRQLLQHLAGQLRHVVYRDLFQQLVADPGHNWTYEELKTLHDLALIMFLYETGCRAGEVVNLSAAAMNEVTGRVVPAYVVTSHGKTGVCYLRFTNSSAELWRLWQQVRPVNRLQQAFWSWRRGCEPVPANTHGLSSMLHRRCSQANVGPFRCHALRHAKVKRSRRLVGLEVTQSLIDHSSLLSTVGYANVDGDDLAAATVKTGLNGDLWGQ